MVNQPVTLREALLELARSWEDRRDQALERSRRGETVVEGSGAIIFVGALDSCVEQLRSVITDLEGESSPEHHEPEGESHGPPGAATPS